jgi:hypothetical protein
MPPLAQVIAAIAEYINDNAVKILTGLLLMGVGWYLGKRRARNEWRKQEFLDRLNISLNSIIDGTLQIRTLSEKRIEDVLLNTVATDRMMAAAKRTTATDPLLPISQADYWYFLNAVLNELSEQFARGHLQRDLRAPVHTAEYLICLTCECAGELRTRKVRAMVVQKSLLTALPKDPPRFLATRHQTRWTTLQAMAAEYQKNPWRFLDVELSV